jgi:hypothetical protein
VKLSLDIEIHVHDFFDGSGIVGDIGIAADPIQNMEGESDRNSKITKTKYEI